MFYKYKKGFTLFELLITVAILAIVCTIALPYFHQHMAAQERYNVLINLRNSIYSAKNIANVQRQSITICPSQDLLQCEKHQWGTGFIVFIDKNKNRQVESEDTIIRTEQHQLKYGSLNWRGTLNLPSLIFKAENGLPLGSNGSFYYCSTHEQEHFRLIMSKMGQVRVETITECN